MGYAWWFRPQRMRIAEPPKYEAMQDSDSATEEEDHQFVLKKRNNCQWIPKWAIIASLSVALTVSLGVTFTLLNQQAKRSTAGELFSCGKNLDDAIRKGCTWDELTNSWLPAECPRAGEAEYMASWGNQGGAKSWIVYSDRNGTTQVDRSRLVFQNSSDLFTGHTVWWTTEGQHSAHCLFLLQRLTTVTSAGGRLDFMTGNPSHAQHCIRYLFNMARSSPTWDKVSVRGQSGIGWC